MRIGRTQLCPCGSGNKFKKCCLGKGDQGALPWPVFPEDFAIGRLREESQRFADFYTAERPKIRTLVYWAKDDKLPEGIWGRSSWLSTGEAVVRLANIPASVDQDYNVAHELEHLVLGAEGFPMTGSAPEHESISSAVNSILHDPLVHERLEVHGYRDDVSSEYENESSESRRQLKNLREPANRTQSIHWTLNYAANLIDGRQLSGTEANPSEFQEWFSARYPDIARDAQDLIAMVDRIGYETPERMRVALLAILERYSLRDIIL